MRAIVIRRHGDPDVLEAAEIARPQPAPREALVRVEAVSVNAFLDVSNRAGRVPSDARERIRELTGGLGVDVVLDNLAAPTLWQLGMDVLGPRGRIVTSGAKFGGSVEVDLRRLYTMSQRLVGLRSASGHDHDAFWKLVETAALRPLVDSTFPLDAVADAHRHIEAGANVGRVVLTVNGSA